MLSDRLAQAAARGKVPPRTVAIAGAVGSNVVDLWFVARGRISRVYLVDAAAEPALVTVAEGGKLRDQVEDSRVRVVPITPRERRG